MDSYFLILAVLVALALYLSMYIFSRFTYTVTSEALLIIWYVLGIIPFWDLRIRLDQIVEVHKFDFRKDFWGVSGIWGKFPWPKGTIIITTKRFYKKIWVTPKDPQSFIEQIKHQKQ